MAAQRHIVAFLSASDEYYSVISVYIVSCIVRGINSMFPGNILILFYLAYQEDMDTKTNFVKWAN